MSWRDTIKEIPQEQPSWKNTVREENEVSPEVGFGEAALKSGLQSATFGTSDEIIGAINALARAKEKAQKGEGFLDKISRLYEEERDKERQFLKRAEEEAPVGSLLGGLAGGFVLPGKWLAEGGVIGKQVASAAPKFLGKTIPAMITGGAEAGALYGYGTSEKETLPEQIDDAVSSAKSGAVLGGALGVAGKALGGLGSLIGQASPRIKGAFERGKQGVDITSPGFEKNVIEGIQKESGELAGVLSKEKSAIEKNIASGEKEAFNILQKSKENVSKNIDKLKQETIELLENQKELQKNQNEILYNKGQEHLRDKAIDIEKKLDGVRKDIGKEFDTIESIAMDKNVQINAIPIFNDLSEKLSSANLNEQTINKITNRIKHLNKTIDFKGFQELKREIRNLFDNDNPTIRLIGKKTYGSLNQELETSLRNQNLPELADQLKDTNFRWRTYLDMDNFFESADPLFQKFYGAPKSIKTIEKLAKTEAGSSTLRDQLKDRLSKLMPNLGEAELDEMIKLSENVAATKSSKVEVPGLVEKLSVSPEFSKKQQLLDELKSIKPKELESSELEQINKIIEEASGPESAKQFSEAISKIEAPARKTLIEQFGSTPESVKKKLMTLIPKAGEKFGSFTKQEELQDLLNIYKQNVGPEKAQKMSSKLEEIAQDIELGKTIHQTEPKLGGTSALGTAANTLSAAGTRISNFAGLKVNDLLNATPEQLAVLAKTSNKAVKDILSKLGTRDKVGRQALIFNLMQSPSYRELFDNESKE